MGDIGGQQDVPPVRMLIINPNTSVSMTQALKPMVEALDYQAVSVISFEFSCVTSETALPLMVVIYLL